VLLSTGRLKVIPLVRKGSQTGRWGKYRNVKKATNIKRWLPKKSSQNEELRAQFRLLRKSEGSRGEKEREEDLVVGPFKNDNVDL